MIWAALERVIPDLRQRTQVSFVGSPLTHQHFLRRHQGTYGPGIMAGEVGGRGVGLAGCGVGAALPPRVQARSQDCAIQRSHDGSRSLLVA